MGSVNNFTAVAFSIAFRGGKRPRSAHKTHGKTMKVMFCADKGRWPTEALVDVGRTMVRTQSGLIPTNSRPARGRRAGFSQSATNLQNFDIFVNFAVKSGSQPTNRNPQVCIWMAISYAANVDAPFVTYYFKPHQPHTMRLLC